MCDVVTREKGDLNRGINALRNEWWLAVNARLTDGLLLLVHILENPVTGWLVAVVVVSDGRRVGSRGLLLRNAVWVADLRTAVLKRAMGNSIRPPVQTWIPGAAHPPRDDSPGPRPHIPPERCVK